MKERKLQVFVSSTYIDLIEERQAAVEAILAAGHIPAGMELFSAGDEQQMTVIKRWIDESDVYLLILAGRYGSIEPVSGKSYTQLEFEYAVEQKKPLFAVVIKPEALNEKIGKLKGNAIDSPKEAETFRKLITDSQIVKFFNTTSDIKLAIFQTLAEFEHSKNLVGWVRADRAVDNAMIAEQMAALMRENSELKRATETKKEESYNGLSMRSLLKLILAKNEKITYKDEQLDLLDIIFKLGKEFAGGLRVSDNDLRKSLKTLTELKIIFVHRTLPTNRLTEIYLFTEDGHKFYLKLQSLEPDEYTYYINEILEEAYYLKDINILAGRLSANE